MARVSLYANTVDTPIRFDPRISAAIRDCDLDAAKRLFEELPGYERGYTPFVGGTWLHFAAAEGCFAIVEHLLSRGLSVNEPARRDGRFPIGDAAIKGRVEMVAFLLGRGATLDTSTSLRNPLFSAITVRSAAVAELLIVAGIDTRVRYNTETMRKMDAVAFAMMMGPRDIARMIALHNADGDEAAVEVAMAEGLRIADLNAMTMPESRP